MMSATLTQPELGILYTEMVAPLGFAQCIQYGIIHDDDALALHQMIADQKPDTALISLGLCGISLANHIMQLFSEEKDLVVLATELKYFSIDVVERFGRAWINAREHDKGDPDEELELLTECPDSLNAFGSIVEEVKEICDPAEDNTTSNLLVSKLCQVLEYQAYAHANLAEQYLDMLGAKKKTNPLASLDHIPAPYDFQHV